MANIQHKQVSQRVVKLLFRIWNGLQPVHTITYYLEYLSLHLPEDRLEPALEWLNRNELRGQKFMDFLNEQCAMSALELIRQITMRIEKEKETRTLFAKDMRLN